jgi:hypothetical protein
MSQSKRRNDSSTQTAIDIDEPKYLAAVEKGKAMCGTMTGVQWALGDLAAEVAKGYGESRLEQFAIDINFPGAPCTLKRYRSVCFAWPKRGVRPRFYASAQILQTHPNRIVIVTENPNISKHEAREIMRRWRAPQNGTTSSAADDVEEDDDLEATEDDDLEATEDGDLEATDTAPSVTTPVKAKGARKSTRKSISDEQEKINENKTWFREELVRANDLISAAQVRHKKYTPKERQDLVKALAAYPTLLATMKQANKEHAEEIAWLEELFAEAREAADAVGHIRRAPNKAARAEPAQVSV